MDVAQYSKEMFENRLFFFPKSPPDFREISSLICEHEDLQGNWKGRQLTWIVGRAFLCDMSLGSSLLQDISRTKCLTKFNNGCKAKWIPKDLESSELMITHLKVKFVL